MTAPKGNAVGPRVVREPTPEERRAAERLQVLNDLIEQARQILPNDPAMTARMAEIADRKIREADARHAQNAHGWRGVALGVVGGAGLALLGVTFVSGDLAQRLAFLANVARHEAQQQDLDRDLADRMGEPK